MLLRLKRLWGSYPPQFWLMFLGMLVSTIGSSMVWPFLMSFVTRLLDVPLTTATSLMTINSVVALISAFIAGPIIDRLGRKWMMVLSLLGMGTVYLFYTQAHSYAFVALLMAGTGVFNPLYRVGADAMMADLIPPPQRPSGYALLRMANNLGISIGPMIGGYVAVRSYNIAFLGAAAGFSIFAVLIAIFARETLATRIAKQAVDADPAADQLPGATTQPAAEAAVAETAAVGKSGAAKIRLADASTPPAPAAVDADSKGNPADSKADPKQPKKEREPLGGYLKVLSDRQFLSFIVAFTLTQCCAALIWILLNVHMLNNYDIPESQYGSIAMTNAVMVVVFQALVTRQTRKRAELPVMAIGSLFYAVAVVSIAFMSGFWGFWLSMVIMTTGELLLMPTSTTYTANLAPAHMRGRYMSVYSLTWGIAQGLAPLSGGFLADNLGPSAPWIGGGVVGALAVAAFVVMAGRRKAELAVGD